MFGEIDRRVPLKSRGLGAKLEANTQQTISNAAYNVLTWDTIIRDDLRTVDLVNFNDRIRIKDEGWYLITAFASYTGNFTGSRYLDAFLNGTSIVCYVSAGCAGNDGGPVNNIGFGYYCYPGDYWQIRVYQNSGGSLTMHNYPPYANFAIAKLGA